MRVDRLQALSDSINQTARNPVNTEPWLSVWSDVVQNGRIAQS